MRNVITDNPAKTNFREVVWLKENQICDHWSHLSSWYKMVFEFPWWCKYCRRLVFCPCASTVVHQKHPTGLCEHCGEEESVEHVPHSRTWCPWGGGLRALWAALYEEAQLSPVPLFEERGAAVCFPRFKTHRCRGTEANEIVGFAVGCGWWVGEGPPLFARRPRTRVSCWIVMMRSFWHHQMQQLVLRCIWTSFWRLWIIKINLK